MNQQHDLEKLMLNKQCIDVHLKRPARASKVYKVGHFPNNGGTRVRMACGYTACYAHSVFGVVPPYISNYIL